MPTLESYSAPRETMRSKRVVRCALLCTSVSAFRPADSIIPGVNKTPDMNQCCCRIQTKPRGNAFPGRNLEPSSFFSVLPPTTSADVPVSCDLLRIAFPIFCHSRGITFPILRHLTSTHEFISKPPKGLTNTLIVSYFFHKRCVLQNSMTRPLKSFDQTPVLVLGSPWTTWIGVVWIPFQTFVFCTSFHPVAKLDVTSCSGLHFPSHPFPSMF